jgi:hypothetical protein
VTGHESIEEEEEVPMVRHFAGAIALTATSALSLLASRSARAETRVVEVTTYERPEPESRFDFGFDGDGAAMIAPPRSGAGETLTGGTGFKLRFGDQIHLHGLRITPEGGYAYEHLVATDDAGAAHDWETHRLFGGARLSFGYVVTPGFYAHLGYGWRNTGDPSVPQLGGLALDAGVALDFHILRHFVFGAHAEYVTIDTQPYTPQWLALGLHGDVVF